MARKIVKTKKRQDDLISSVRHESDRLFKTAHEFEEPGEMYLASAYIAYHINDWKRFDEAIGQARKEYISKLENASSVTLKRAYGERLELVDHFSHKERSVEDYCQFEEELGPLIDESIFHKLGAQMRYGTLMSPTIYQNKDVLEVIMNMKNIRYELGEDPSMDYPGIRKRFNPFYEELIDGSLSILYFDRCSTPKQVFDESLAERVREAIRGASKILGARPPQKVIDLCFSKRILEATDENPEFGWQHLCQSRALLGALTADERKSLMRGISQNWINYYYAQSIDTINAQFYSWNGNRSTAVIEGLRKLLPRAPTDSKQIQRSYNNFFKTMGRAGELLDRDGPYALRVPSKESILNTLEHVAGKVGVLCKGVKDMDDKRRKLESKKKRLEEELENL